MHAIELRHSKTPRMVSSGLISETRLKLQPRYHKMRTRNACVVCVKASADHTRDMERQLLELRRDFHGVTDYCDGD